MENTSVYESIAATRKLSKWTEFSGWKQNAQPGALALGFRAHLPCNHFYTVLFIKIHLGTSDTQYITGFFGVKSIAQLVRRLIVAPSSLDLE